MNLEDIKNNPERALEYIQQLEQKLSWNIPVAVHPKVNRVEVIDKTGRAYTNHEAFSVECHLQDNEKTLKIFSY